MISPERAEQLKSYGIGGGGAAGGYASKKSGWLDASDPFFAKFTPWFADFWPDFLSVLQDLTIVAGFLLVIVRLAIDIRKWWRGRNPGINGESGSASRSVAVAFASAGGLAVLLSMAAPVVIGFEGKTNHAIIPVPGDVPTICHGHTKTAAMGQLRTDAECEALLAQDLTASFNVLARRVHVDLPPETWVALASFEFNIGEGNFAASTALKKINAGDIRGGCEAIATKVIGPDGICRGYGCGWSGGNMVKSLQKRRVTERDMCLKGLVVKAAPQAEPPWWKFWARWT